MRDIAKSRFEPVKDAKYETANAHVKSRVGRLRVRPRPVPLAACEHRDLVVGAEVPDFLHEEVNSFSARQFENGRA